MKSKSILGSAVACLLGATTLLAETNFYVSDNAALNDKWNAASANKKWTANGGTTYVNANNNAGNVYHTNGYSLRAGRIGDLNGGDPNPFVFNGPVLVIDGFSSASSVPDNTSGGGGILIFDIAATPAGPRVSGGNPTKANYVGNIVADALGNSPGSIRTIRASNGETTLDGTIRLNGPVIFTVPTGTNDSVFTVKSAVHGTGTIELSGGSAGGSTLNGYVVWEFENLNDWKGASITVQHKHTVSFTSDIDFTVTNPTALLNFPSTSSVGFLKLEANAAFASGKVKYGSNVLADGTYTAAQLNAIWNTGTYATQPFADGPGTLTVKPVSSLTMPPAVTSSSTAAGTVGVPFSYLITATGATTTFSATSLPAGLSVDSATGRISGTPTTPGTSSVTLGATNAGGTGGRTLTLTISAATATTHAFAGGHGMSSTPNSWNDATADTAYKWTSDAGSSYLAAASGKTYHTNGYTVKAGRIGSPTGGSAASGPEPYTTFAGDELIVDGYDAASGVTSNATAGTLWFQLASGDAGPQAMVGPRAGDATDTTTRGTYIGDIVTAATTSGTTRYLRSDTGRTALDGALTLNGDTVFWTGSNDAYLKVKSPVYGTGSILLRDGPAGATQVNGWVTFAFDDLANWRGAAIKAIHKVTLSFTGDVDFSATNPTAIIHFPTTVASVATVGFLDLSANITVLPGQLGYGGAYESSTMTTTLTTPGTYTAAQLNTYFSVAGFAAGSGTVTVVPKMTLASSGTPNAVILTAPSPTGPVTKAAEELQKHLQLISGATLPIDTVGNEASHPGKRFIYVGANTASTAAGISTAALENEFFVIRTVGGDLHIVGKDAGNNDWTQLSNCQPGTLFGVYHLLGEVLGVRWLWPGDDGIVYTANANLDVPSLNLTAGPNMVQRRYRNPRVGMYKNGVTSYGFGIPVLPTDGPTRVALADEEVLWQRRQMMGTRKNPSFGHSELHWWDTYGATHPEYFAVRPNNAPQPAPAADRVKLHVSGTDTINARVAEWVAAGSPNNFNVCPNDSRAFCICSSCLAWDYPSQSASIVYNESSALLGDRYARWYSEIATRVAAINPNATVYGYAYDVYRNAPSVATLPSNVAIAYIPGPPSDVRPALIAETETNVLGWIAAGCTQMYLRPNWMLSAHAGPYVPVHRVGEHFKTMLSGGYLLGMDSDSSNSSYAGFGLYFYLIAQQMAHPTRPVDTIIDEYCAGFGSASARIRDYFRYWENFIYDESDNGNNDILGWTAGMAAYGPTFTNASFDGAEQILDDAAVLLGSGEIEAAGRIEFLRTAITHGRLTAEAIRLVDPATPVSYNPSADAAMRALLAFRDSEAGQFTIWREWTIDRESYVPGMQSYWEHILANP